jgi:DNA-binding beta-propeller fold protein YncE
MRQRSAPLPVAAAALGILLTLVAATAALAIPPEWIGSYDGPGTKDDVPRAIALSPDGSIVVTTGESATPRARTNAVTIARDAATGAVLWTAIENDGPDDGMFDVAFDPAGAFVYVTGKDGTDAGPSDDALVVAYDAHTGARAWKTALRPPNDRVQTTMLAVSPSGKRIVVAGRTWNAPVRTYVAGLDAADGAPAWETFEGDTPQEGFRPLPVDIAFDPAGNAITAATALSRTGIGGDVHVTSYRGPSGARRWGTTYDGPAAGPDQAAQLAIAPDGATVYVAGSAELPGRRSDVLGLALATGDGAVRWDAHYNGAIDGFDDGSTIVATPDGRRVVIAGSTQRAGNRFPHEDYVVVARRASTGAPVWDTTYDGPAHGFDLAQQLAIGGDASIIVTGTSEGRGGDADVATLSLNPNGSRRWKARAGDPSGDDAGVDLVGGPARAYVAASFARAAPLGQDLVTLAYPLAGY